MKGIKIIIMLLLVLFIENIAIAQLPSDDPTWKKIDALSDEFTSLDCNGGGVYYLNNLNSSPSWTVISSASWPHSTHGDGATYVAVNGSTLFAGTSPALEQRGNLYKATLSGSWSTWGYQFRSPTDGGSTPYITSRFITAIAFGSGSTAYAGTEGCVDYYNGTSWSNITGSSNWCVTSLAVSGSNVFAGTYGTSDGGVNLWNGSSWSTVNSGLSNIYVTSLAIISGSSLVAGTMGGGIYYSSNNGTSWTNVNGSGLSSTNINALAYDASASTLIAGTDAGVFYSSNFSGGSPTWSSTNSSLTNTYVTCLSVVGTHSVVAGTGGGGVFYNNSYNTGASWSTINTVQTTGSPLLSLNISSLSYDGTNSRLYVGVCPKWRVLDNNLKDGYLGADPSMVSQSGTIVELQDGPNKYPSSSNQLQNGIIETFNSKYEYGYYELYAKAPYTVGSLSTDVDQYHPAFWPYYSSLDWLNYSPPNPMCILKHRELDIFEPGGTQYHGNTVGNNFWFESVANCTTTIMPTGFNLYDCSCNLWNYHKFALEFGPDRMIWYFDGNVIFDKRASSYYSLAGQFQVNIGAQTDNVPTLQGIPGYHYLSGDSVSPSTNNTGMKLDYFHYYRLNFQCSNSKTVDNNSNSANTMNLTVGANAYVPAVYSVISIVPTSALSFNSSTDNSVFRAVNSITINPTGSGSFSVLPSSGKTFTLLPTICDH